MSREAKDPMVVSLFERCKKKAKLHKLKIEIKSEAFFLYRSNKMSLGAFATVQELYCFLCGYDYIDRYALTEGEKGKKI